MAEVTLPKLVVDTNILIDSPEILLNGEYAYVIPYTVLSELDGLKKDIELSGACRRAIKIIYRQMKAGVVHIVDVPTGVSTNDEKIVKTAKQIGCPILTDDIGARAVATATGVDVLEDDDKDDHEHYFGYQYVNGDLDYEYHWVAHKEVQLVEMEEKFDIKLGHNEYVIVKRLNMKEDIWVRKNGNAVQRISQSIKPIRETGITVAPLDSPQWCAVHAVMDKTVPLTIIEGKLGTGKTLLSLIGALSCVNGYKQNMFYETIYVTRPNLTIDPRLRLGFRPGSTEDKFDDWLAGIRSNLKFLFKEDEAEKVFAEYFKMLPLETIQGLSLHNSIILVDEYELLTKDVLKMLLSRASEGAKIVLMGDVVGQLYGINRGLEGFKVLHTVLGENPILNYVKLDEIYRSELAKFVDELFEGK